MTQPLLIKFYSTSSIKDEIRLQEFSERIKRHFGVRQLEGEYLAEGQSDPIRFSDLGELLRQGLPQWLGCLTVVFGIGKGCSGRCDLMRLKKKRGTSLGLGEMAQFRCHEFTLEIEAGSRHELLRQDLFDFFCDLTTMLKAEIGLCHDDHQLESALYSPLGLEAGLPGLFRLTAFGPTYTKLIGPDRLRGLKAHKSRDLTGGFTVIQLDGELSRDLTPEGEGTLNLAKKALGADFFADTRPVKLEIKAGEVGLMSVLSAMLKSRRDTHSKTRLAKKRPHLDWSGVFTE